MKQKLVAILYCLMLFAFGCKKKEKSKESTWTANGDTFNAIAEITLGKAIAGLSSNDRENRFNVFFRVSFLPREGTWPISSSASQNPDYAYATFYYKGGFYLYSPNQSTILNASVLNNKVHYALTPSWFLNYDDPADSVLISGDFYEP